MSRMIRPGSKYGAVPTFVDGIRFHSKKEARRYGDLSILVRVGAIKNLELQPSFKCMVMGRAICTYIADFRYEDASTGASIVEDVKGVRTEIYRLKKRLVEALYPVTISEV